MSWKKRKQKYNIIYKQINNKIMIKAIFTSIFLFLNLSLWSQTAQTECDVIDTATQQRLQKIFENVSKNVFYGKNFFVVEIADVSPNTFALLCNVYKEDFYKWIEQNKTTAENYIMYSCTFENNHIVKIQMYFEELTPQKETTTIKQRLDKTIEELEWELKKTRNNIAMYNDLNGTLSKEISYNLVETANQAGDLLLKHIDLPNGFDKIAELAKNEGMEYLREKTETQNTKPIENKTADVVNYVVDKVDKIAGIIPAGSKITGHPLYLLFKSTPEVGKGLGHIAASVNIYFRKNEYKKQVEVYKTKEQQQMQELNRLKEIRGDF